MKLKNLLLAVCLIVSGSVSAALDNDLYCGVDGVYSSLKLSPDTGFQSMRTSFPSVNVFAGVHLNESLSLEAGFHFSKPSARTTVATGERTVDTVGGREFHKIHKGIAVSHEPYLSLMISGPVMSDSIQVFGGVGVVHASVKYHVKTTHINGVRIDESHALEKTRFIHRLTLGTIYHLNKDFSIRATSFIKNTSKLAVSNHKVSIEPKNSIHHAIGVLYKF